jgi:hypothetical protein
MLNIFKTGIKDYAANTGHSFQCIQKENYKTCNFATTKNIIMKTKYRTIRKQQQNEVTKTKTKA